MAPGPPVEEDVVEELEADRLEHKQGCRGTHKDLPRVLPSMADEVSGPVGVTVSCSHTECRLKVRSGGRVETGDTKSL